MEKSILITLNKCEKHHQCLNEHALYFSPNLILVLSCNVYIMIVTDLSVSVRKIKIEYITEYEKI